MIAPDPIALAPLLVGLDYAGVAVFAATGALAAARKQHDLVTFAFFGAATGVGGGTLRDLLIGAPVFWVREPTYVAVCIAAACAIWVMGTRAWRFNALLWLDALGLAAYGVIGAAKAAAYGVPPLVCIVMGALTACFGGVVRDVLAGEPSILLRREITVSAALLAAATFVVLRWLGLPELVAMSSGFGAGFALRAGAIAWGWQLPGFSGMAPEDEAPPGPPT
ncbi:MAG: trimeric intracellular cation channel family protein [Caulobacteraceae bacterium]|nr:trimeric intracellular cation channel family protein [Caulobacteraceae bacterium]